MLAAFRRLVPVGARRFLRALPYIGLRYHCPCCNWRFSRLRPHGVRPRANAKCPRCGSLERHRVLWRFLQQRLSLPPHAVVLHIAPEPVLARWFRERAARYVAGDLTTLPADVLLDVTTLPFASDTFHAICCVHVLEHVRDDLHAMRELYRVLKPGGWALLSTPHDASRQETVEDGTITTPEGRLAAFGQDDHLRVYGLDLADRLRCARFEVEWTEYARTLPASEFERQRLETHAVIVGRKDLLLETRPAARSQPAPVTLPATEGYRSPPAGGGQRSPERAGIGDRHEVAGEGK